MSNPQVQELRTTRGARGTLGLSVSRRSSTKSFHHRTVGDLTLQHEVLRVDGGRRLSIYQAPPATNDHDALVLLAMSAEASS